MLLCQESHCLLLTGFGGLTHAQEGIPISACLSAYLLPFCKLPPHYPVKYVSPHRNTEYAARQGSLTNSLASNVINRHVNVLGCLCKGLKIVCNVHS